MVFFVFYIVLSILVGVFASSKGRSGGGFFFLSLLLSPLLGLLIALVASPNQAVVEAKKLQDSANKKCPHCAEIIKAEATVCRYCGKEQEAEPEPEPEQSAPPPEEPEPPEVAENHKPTPQPRPRSDRRRQIARASMVPWAKVSWVAVALVAGAIVVTALFG